MVVTVEILSGGALANGTLGIDVDKSEEQALKPLVGLFRHDQRNGEVRMFDPRVMARTSARRGHHTISAHSGAPPIWSWPPSPTTLRTRSH